MTKGNELLPELLWTTDESATDLRWSLEKTQVIGRENADISILLNAISRRHAKVYVKVGYCAIEDLDSRNGTSVNGNMLESGVLRPIRDGDVVLLAGVAELLFKDPMATPIAPRIGKLRGLWIDEETTDVWIDAQKVIPALSGKQFALLQLIYRADGKIVSRDEIVSTVWAYASADGISNDAVDSLIKRLRKKLSDYSSTPLLEQVRDKGIRLVTEPR